MKNRLLILLMVAAIFPVNVFAWQGMPTPMLHVEGRYLKNPNGENVTLRGGWMQPTDSWFNGQGRWYSNPSDWTNPDDVAGMLNFFNDTADLMSDTSPRYGKDHGWYASFVRLNLDGIGGWTHEAGLVDQTQFNAWIQNFIVPYANHLKSRGLYLIISATGPVTTPNKKIAEHSRLHAFWNTVASAPGVKNADNIMFELLNEPVDIESSPGNGDWGHGEAKYFSAFRDWIQPVIDGIRDTGANNVIWVPTLEWQGSPQQHAQYPFRGTNCGIAAHYYPAYGGCYDDAYCHNNLWNRNYKPATDKWPMIITENFWFPEDNGLCAGSTANYGNTLKANIDKEGNVSYMIGFIGDLLDDLNNARPENCSLSSKEGAQAAFEWWYQSNSQSTSCTPTTITPYVQVDDGNWQQTASVTVDAGAKVKFGPQPTSGDSWSWSGGGTSSTTREQTIYPASSVTATATYTNTCGAESTQNFTVNVNQDSPPDSPPSALAIENGRYNIVSSLSGLYLDVDGARMDDGTNVIQYTNNGGSNQQFDVTALDDGTYSIRAVHSGKSLDVYSWNENDGAELRQWTYTGASNQRWHIDDAGNGLYSIISAYSNKAIDVWEMNRAVGADVKLYTWWGDANQKWSFVPVGSTPNPTPTPEPTPNPDGAAGCGSNPGLTSGRHSINVDGAHREYIIDIPGNYDRNKPYRLIFGWHPLGGSADGIAGGGYYGLRDQARGEAIFVAPDRYNVNGQDDSGWPNTNGRDMQFLRAMLDEIKGSLCIDNNRVFSVGWSYGGMMSLAVGREMAGTFRAVAPMSGALWTPFNDNGKPTAAWISHGIYDDFVNYSTVGIEAKDYYVRANHCSNNTVPVDPSPCVEYQGCDAGHPVVWCPFFGHHGTPDFSPTAIWNFFNRF
jgi:poly(3-hydroxybutyrate) depolymerase